MAEAAVHNASYLSWPTWPGIQRQRIISSIRPQADLLLQSEPLLNDTRPRADVVLFLPFRRWVETDQCAATSLATALSQANFQYEVLSEDAFNLSPSGGHRSVFLVESLSGAVKFTTQRPGDDTLLEISIPRLEISAIVVIEP